MKCPVCKTECHDEHFCPECGFDQLNTVFVNKDDATSWIQTVVVPFRDEYWLRKKSLFEIEGTVLRKYMGTDTIVKVPYGITSIDAYAFRSNTEVEYIELPSTVVIIGDGAFSRCRHLKRITLPPRVTSWGKRIFSDCHKLENVCLPEGIVDLDGTFYMCGMLRSLSIPSTVRSINGAALIAGFKNGLDISFRAPNPDFDLKDGFLIQKSTQTLIRYIGPPVDVLRTPHGVKYIDQRAFQRCEHTLKTVFITEGVESISSHVFFSCFELNTIVIPSTVKDIGNNVFLHCPRLLNILIDPSNKHYCVIENYIVDKRNNSIIQVIDRTIKEAIIPDGIQEIGSLVFDYCEFIEKVTMPDSVVAIKKAAFQSCKTLKDIRLSNSLKTIENGAFCGTGKLIDIVIPASVCDFGEHIFIMEDQPKRIFCEHYSWQLNMKHNWTGCNGTVYPRGSWHYEDGKPVPN